jgi:hypothetical protein
MSRDHLHPVTGSQSAGTWNSAANGRMSFPQVSRSGSAAGTAGPKRALPPTRSTWT